VRQPIAGTNKIAKVAPLRGDAGKIRMHKTALIALALTGASTVGLAGGIDDAFVNTVNAGIDRGIASVQAKLPLSFGPGITVTGLRREGRTIIYTMDF
jgi:hypothetical protein